jgi:hypothetical protein
MLRAEVHSQGNRFQLVLKGVRRLGGGIRGRVRGFSAASRKRFVDSVTSLELGRDVRGLFVTLTYKEVPSPSECKQHLDRLGKVLHKEFPKGSAYWRFGLESQGERAYNPHFHYLFFNVKFLPVVWLESVWADVTGGMGGFVFVEEVRGWRGAMAYVTKYMGQVVEERSLDYIAYLTGERWTGRMWGVLNRAGLPIAEAFVVGYPFGPWFYRVKRCGRRVWDRCNKKRLAGFTLYRDDPVQWVRLCAVMVST